MALLAISAYVPPRHVLQEDLEEAHGCPGKYTMGLGQRAMAVAAAGDDAVSMARTALERLLAAMSGDPALRDAIPRVGRLEVATESRLDRAKSVKSELAGLAAEWGVPGDTSGCDVTNACIGGVQALLDSAEFVWARDADPEARAYGIVVTTDIAEYRQPREVPTGGAGALAVLVGPPSLHQGQGLLLPAGGRGRAVWHWEDARDFCKPHLADCVPQVDGAESVRCYLEATERVLQPEAWAEARFCCYHAPFSKMAQKGHLRLHERAGRRNEAGGSCLPDGMEDFASRALPALHLTKLVGNVYTGSLLLCVASVANRLREGETIYCSGYGSGAAACSFVARSAGPVRLGEELRPYLDADPGAPEAPALPGRLSVAQMEARVEARRALARYCLSIDPLARELLGTAAEPAPGRYEVPPAGVGAGAWELQAVFPDGRRVYGREREDPGAPGRLTSSA